MKQIDFTNYKFRCSSLPDLMTKSRSASDLLSETAKSKLDEIWIREVYGREKFDTKNKYTEKGIACEPDSMDLIKQVTKQTYFKNNDQLENEFITGTPDIIVKNDTAQAKIKDVKSAYDLFTFKAIDEAEANKRYYWQMFGYMWLATGDEAELNHCLVNTPEEIMNDELMKLSYKYPEINESEEKMERFKKNYIFDDIPAKERLKRFVIKFNPEDIESLKQRIIFARIYLNSIGHL